MRIEGVEIAEDDHLRSHLSHDVSHLLRRWRAVARAAQLQATVLAEVSGYEILGLRNRSTVAGPGLYLSAGIHGDEAGAVLGLLEWAEGNLDVLRTHPVVIFPIVNPWGVAHNKREDESGRDLNRAFDEFSIEPIGAMLDFIAGVEFAVAVSLHEDYDANGVYLYELARRGERWGDELLQRVEGVLPRLEGATVEGRRAVNGVLRRTQGLKKIAREIDGMPESIALYLSHARTALTFETPSEFSISRRVKAHMRFLDGVVARVIRSGE